MDSDNIIRVAVLRIEGDEVIVDIGDGKEGLVSLDEWSQAESQPQPSQTFEVFLQELEDLSGRHVTSKRLADRIRRFEDVAANLLEGDLVTGKVTRQIRGGLLVDVDGVGVVLPASQVDLCPPEDIGTYVGQEIECVILKILRSHSNIVVSRRRLLEEKQADGA